MAAIDHIVPDNVTGPLQAYLTKPEILALYDDDTMSNSIASLGDMLTEIGDDEPAMFAFGRMGTRNGYRPPDQAIGPAAPLTGSPVTSYTLELTGWSSDIVLCSDGACQLDAGQRDKLARNGIAVREEKIARLEGQDGRLERIVFTTGEPIARRAMFFTTGQHPCSPLAEKLGCQFNEKGTVRTGKYETTHIPGLYVAGDASRDVQWVVVAAAEGAEAAFSINQDLIEASWK